MSNTGLTLKFWSLALILCAFTLAARAQTSASEDAVLSTRIPHLDLVNQTLHDGLASLSLNPTPLSLGFENVLKARFSDPELVNPRFDLHLDGKTIGEILNTLCSMDSRYTWSRDGNTINVYPKAADDDPFYFLNRKLDRLNIVNITDIQRGLLAIIQELPGPREQVGIAQVGGNDSYAIPWTASFEDLTVRQAINRLAEHLGSRSYWTLSGARDFRHFGFFGMGFYPNSR
jgi:hypothetical protein